MVFKQQIFSGNTEATDNKITWITNDATNGHQISRIYASTANSAFNFDNNTS